MTDTKKPLVALKLDEELVTKDGTPVKIVHTRNLSEHHPYIVVEFAAPDCQIVHEMDAYGVITNGQRLIFNKVKNDSTWAVVFDNMVTPHAPNREMVFDHLLNEGFVLERKFENNVMVDVVIHKVRLSVPKKVIW